MRRQRLAKDELLNHAAACGWIRLDRGEQPRQARFYYWAPNITRIEVLILFDPLGRVTCWSEWHNQRVFIDGEIGQRARLIDRLARGPG